MGFEGDKEARVAADRVPGGSSLLRYNSPLVQVILIGLVCFCCPSMFNALSGMRGGGQIEPTAASNANNALYVTFSIFGDHSRIRLIIVGCRLPLVLRMVVIMNRANLVKLGIRNLFYKVYGVLILGVYCVVLLACKFEKP